MKKITFYLVSICMVLVISIFGQEADSLKNSYTNTVEKMLADKPGLGIGGYSEVHYNQPIVKNTKQVGILDVHRTVLFLGYNFSKNTQFISEIEFVHAKELWVEQAFLQRKLHKYINFRAGLLLIPMGIINETHEPTTFNGVERPTIDNIISPTTWREVGMGFSGNIQPAFLKYQFYVIGGMNGYNTKGIFTGSQPLRNGRQNGSKAYMTSPNYTGRLEYYGINNFSLGASYYGGKSQSQLYGNLHTNSKTLKEKADSSVVEINMIGTDLRYNNKGVQIKGQLYYTTFSNTEKYNKFTSVDGKYNDLGKSIIGYYAEIGYNFMHLFKKSETVILPFFRYENYNLHHSVDNFIIKNDNYKVLIITTGITVKLNKGAVLKTDFQLLKSKADVEFSKIFNAGVGVTF